MHPTARGLYAVETYDMHPGRPDLGAFELNTLWKAAESGFAKYRRENPAQISAYKKYLPQVSLPVPKVVKDVGGSVFTAAWRDAVQMFTDKKKAMAQAASIGAPSGTPTDSEPSYASVPYRTAPGPNWLMIGGGVLAIAVAAKLLKGGR
jgi:hypothetical protein